MAKLEGADAIMSAAEMKPLLLLSKHEHVSCAIGMTKDKQGVVLLERKGKPKKAMALLRKAAAGAHVEMEASSLRFGRAFVDTEADSGLVHFSVNREAPGALRPKLVEQLKKAGFGRCEITVDAALDAEPEEDGEHPAGAAPPHALPEGDAAAATQRLTGLVKHMIAVLPQHPESAEAMKAAARTGQEAIKAGNLQLAAWQADQLEQMLHAGAPPAGGIGAGAGGGGPKLGHEDSSQVRATLKQLDAAHGHAAFVVIDGTQQKLDDVVKTMHDRLREAEHRARKLVASYSQERHDMPGVDVFGRKCDGYFDDFNAALNAHPPQLAHAYDSLQMVYHGFDAMQSEVSAEQGNTIENWTLAMEGAKSVRQAAGVALVVIATRVAGKPGGMLADTFNKALEVADDTATGEKVNVVKLAGEMVVEVLVNKFEVPIGKAIEKPIAAWMKANVTPGFRVATDSALYKSFAKYMAEHAKDIPVGSEKFWAELPAYIKGPRFAVQAIGQIKTMLVENGKSVLVEIAGIPGAPEEYTHDKLMKKKDELIANLEHGQVLREKWIPALFAHMVAHG